MGMGSNFCLADLDFRRVDLGGGGETAAVEIPSRHADITGRALTDSAPHALACK